MMKSDKYSAKADDNFEFEINKEALANLDIIPIGNGSFHILKNNKSYTAEVLSTDYNKKTFTISINGNEHVIQLSDNYDLLVKKMGLNVASSAKMNDLKAPMPGLVLEVMVEVGQAFEKGDALIILEAMKMENIIKATGEGVVKSIVVKKTDAVEKGQILLELE